MWEAYVLWKSVEIWTVDEIWITYELKGISYFRNWICLQFIFYSTCDYLSRMWSATDWNPDDRFQPGANRSVFSCHRHGSLRDLRLSYSCWVYWDVQPFRVVTSAGHPVRLASSSARLHFTNTPAGSTNAIANTDDLIDTTLKYIALTAGACSLYPTGADI